jgi:4-hydroxyphenylacetate 3-hydroxylase, reductase component
LNAPGRPPLADLPEDPSPLGLEVAAVDAPEPVTSQRLREALGRFATGVTIITCLDEHGERLGLTANSFNALSLDPPLVLWSLRRQSAQLAAFAAAGAFVVNVLARQQLALSRRFASKLDDKFDDGDWSAGWAGAPVLAGCVAVFQCEMLSQQDAGDHVLFIGRVLALSQQALAPLLYHAGHYHGLGDTL